MKVTTKELMRIVEEETRRVVRREADKEQAAPEAGAKTAEAGKGEEQGGDVGNFADKLRSSGLDDYVMKINKPDELYGLLSVILKTALDSESPIGEQHIAKVLKQLFKGEWA